MKMNELEANKKLAAKFSNCFRASSSNDPDEYDNLLKDLVDETTIVESVNDLSGYTRSSADKVKKIQEEPCQCCLCKRIEDLDSENISDISIMIPSTAVKAIDDDDEEYDEIVLEDTKKKNIKSTKERVIRMKLVRSERKTGRSNEMRKRMNYLKHQLTTANFVQWYNKNGCAELQKQPSTNR